MLTVDYPSCAYAYLDDGAIQSKIWRDRRCRVDIVFNELEGAGSKVNSEKCHVKQILIKFLGHVGWSGRHGPKKEKLPAIEGLATTRTEQ